MDPKVCGKLLTTHRRGLGDDLEALHDRFPLWRSVGEGSKMGYQIQKVMAEEIVFSGRL